MLYEIIKKPIIFDTTPLSACMFIFSSSLILPQFFVLSFIVLYMFPRIAHWSYSLTEM